jgi:hypothetical protein
MILTVVAALGFSLTAGATAAHATKRVQFFLQTPFPWNFSAPFHRSLQDIEDLGARPPLFQERYGIDYDAVQAFVDRQIDQEINKKISGTETCSDPCPDVDWEISPTAKFAFTKRNDPVLTQLGQFGENRIGILLETEVRVDLHADIHWETWSDHGDLPVDAFVVLGVTATGEVALWPNIEVPEVKVETHLVGSNVDLDLNGQAIAIGAKWGAVGGLFVPGGPLVGALLGGLLGDEAAEEAEDRVRSEFSSRLTTLIRQAETEANKAARAAVDSIIKGVPSPRDSLLSFNVPGINMTVGDLNAPIGGALDLHSVTPGGGISVSAVHRFAPQPGSGEFGGEFRFPKEACVRVIVKGGLLDGANVPVGREPANSDLGVSPGVSCASLLDGEGLARRTFLGENPQDALGPAAQFLPYWGANAGIMSFPGNVQDGGNFYSC